MIRSVGSTWWVLAAFVACGGGDDGATPAQPGDVLADASTPGFDAAPTDADAPDGDASTHADGGAEPCSAEPCVRQLALGGAHSCALLADGSIRCWGSNAKGQLGLVDADGGLDGLSTSPPRTVPQLAGTAIAAGGDFRSGWDSTCVLQSTGTVCFGSNVNGLLGRGELTQIFDVHSAPALLEGAVQLSMSAGTSCALLLEGGITCWGSNQFMQVAPDPLLGQVPTPRSIQAAASFTQVAVGATTACAVTSDSHVWCWGSAFGGGLGRPREDAGVADSAPGPVPGIETAQQVAVSTVSGCALKLDGTLSSWGAYSLGRASTDPAPAPVELPAGTRITQVTAFAAYSGGYCALDDAGAVWCWGSNTRGAVGTGSVLGDVVAPAEVTLPTQVLGLSDIVQIASSSGSAHVCALSKSGSVKCWGQNASGQLGALPADAGLSLSTTPVDVVW